MRTLTHQLHELFNERKRFSFPFEQQRAEIPRNGIYIIFEKGEKYCEMDRIVRVGTHTGDRQLRSRLNQHFVNENKNRSIFRKNIGRCILNKENDSYLPLWNLDITSRIDKEKNLGLIDLEYEKLLEKRISEYIQNNLSFCVFQVDTRGQRLHWESKIVSTLAKSGELHPSKNWLGLHSPKDKIRTIGLWQVNELNNDGLDDHEFATLSQMALQRQI